MNTVACLICLGLAALGLSWRRGRTAWLAWLVVLGFALAATMPRGLGWLDRPVMPVRAELAGATFATQALAAAATAGPHGDDLQLLLAGGFADPIVPGGPLGARAALAAPPLPFAPEQLRVRQRSAAALQRPTLLEIAVPAVDAGSAELVIMRGSDEVLRRSLPLDGAVHTIEWTPAAAGEHRLRCAIDVAGVVVAAHGDIAVAAPRGVRVLEPTGLVAAALRAQGVLVEDGAGPVADWSQYAAVVLGAVLPADQQVALVRAVEDGLGLFVLEPAFGEELEPLRALLPVRPTPRVAVDAKGDEEVVAPDTPPPPPPDRGPPAGDTSQAGPVGQEPTLVDKRLVALGLVVDRSGSMGNTLPNGRTKMSYAKSSAMRTAAALGPGDEVVIVTFGNKDAGRLELPLTDASQVDQVRAGAERLAHAAERTFLLSGIRLAAQSLQRSKAAVRHLVVISDGEFDSSESFALRSLANDLFTRQHISLSVIAIIDPFTSPEFKREAEELTRDGGGRFLPLENAELVPTFVTAEVTRSLATAGRQPRGADSPAPEQPQQPPPPDEPPPPPPPEPSLPTGPSRLRVVAVADSPLLRPEPSADWPTLQSARGGEAPLEAEVLLAAGPDGWPLLAYANRGLGRVGAFAADLCGEPCREFRRDAAFPGRLAQWIAHTAMPTPPAAASELLGAPTITPRVTLPAEATAFAALAGRDLQPRASLPTEPRLAVLRSEHFVIPDWLPLTLLLLLAAAERLAARLPLRTVPGTNDNPRA